MKENENTHQHPPIPRVLRKSANWKELRFYKKTDALYQLTYLFCQRFLPKYGDRTVDQMVQAARSGKQNIVEGSEDGKTSTEMELKLLNVARSSIGELREDYQDYINAHHLSQWQPGHERFQSMQDFTKSHNEPEDYMTIAEKWSDEEFANTCLSLCFQVDAMMNSYLQNLERTFVTEGGIKERMYKARTGYRNGVDERMQELESANKSLTEQLTAINTQLSDALTKNQQWQEAYKSLQAKYEDLKQRALKAYNEQKAEIERLQALLEEK